MVTADHKMIVLSLLFVLLFPLQQPAFTENPCAESDDFFISWLQSQTTVEEAEAANMVKNDQLGPDPVPFGFINADWKELLDQMQEGDELWEFKSPPETWENLMGRKGIALIRNCQVIAYIVTLMN
jgi:hypothetical protein